MQRLLVFALTASLVLSIVGHAAAVEVTTSGSFDFTWGWRDQNIHNNTNDWRQGNGSEDKFFARQRERIQVNFIASENVQGTLYFEIGEDEWGVPGQAQIGMDNISVEVRRAYIELNIPNTDLFLRVGMQGLDMPNAVVGSPILGSGGTDMAGIVALYPLDDMFSLGAFWARPWNGSGRRDAWGSSASAYGNGSLNDEVDMFGFYIPVNVEGVMTVTPYVSYMLAGTDALYQMNNPLLLTNANPANNANYQTSATAGGFDARYNNDYQNFWWLGGAFELTLLDPLTFALDVAWGTSIDPSEAYLNRSGWYVAGSVEYQTPYVTPGLLAWWTSGDDGNIWNGSERIPSIDGSFKGTSEGFDGYVLLGTGDLLSQSAEGTWGLAFKLQNISLIKDLTHQLTVAVYWGTNDPESMRDYRVNGGAWNPAFVNNSNTILTTADWAWEVNFDHSYRIYENLALVAEMSMVDVHREKYAWETQADRTTNFGPRLWDTSTAWKLATGLQYRF